MMSTKKIYLISITCFCFILFCMSSYAKDKVNLEVIGRLDRQRGDITCTEIIKQRYPSHMQATYAFCGTEHGFLILDVTDRASIKEVSFLPVGLVNDIVAYKSNNYALLATSRYGLYILNIEDPKNPVPIGHFMVLDCRSLTIQENYAYVATKNSGLLIIDISDPAIPLPAGGYDTKGSAYNIAMKDNYIYVASGDSGLVILDISDPTAPFPVRGYDTGGSAYDLAVKGNYAYVADEYNGLVILDISDPMTPFLAGGYNTTGHAHDIVIKDICAYMACGDGGLIILDISDPTAPFLAGVYDPEKFTAYDIVINDFSAYVVDEDGALVILDLYDSIVPSLAGEYDTSYAYSIVIKGAYAYMASGNRDLVIVDISDPTAPSLVGSDFINGYAYDIAIQGNYAYVATRNKGLIIVDIKDQMTPFLAGGCDIKGNAYAVAIKANYAYVANGYSGLVIVDISDPTAPFLAGIYDTRGWAYDVAIKANYAYVSGGDSGLVILDISDPTTPFLVGQYDTKGDAKGLIVKDNYVYVADGYSGLVIIDISDSTTPFLAGMYKINKYAEDVTIKDNYAYVAGVNDGIVIINISDPAAPFLVGEFDTEGIAEGLTIKDKHAYIADGNNGLVVVSLTHSISPSLVSKYTSPKRYAADVAIKANYAYVAYGYNGLVIVDISDPTAPFLAGSYDTKETGFGIGEKEAFGVAIKGNYAYVANWGNGLVIVDISDPTTPFLAGGLDTKGHGYDVTIKGNYAYVADENGGLAIIDISDPIAPFLAGSYDTNGAALDTAIKGNYAYVADWDKDLVILDISDPTALLMVGKYTTSGYVKGVTIRDNYLYVADGDSGLVILDISDPTTPFLVGGYNIKGSAYDVAIKENYAYVADGDSGLVILDISDPTAPFLAGNHDTKGRAYDVTIEGNYAYVADGESGLIVFHIIDTPLQEGNLVLCTGMPATMPDSLGPPIQALSNKIYSTFSDKNYPCYFMYYLIPGFYQDIDEDNLPNPLVVDDFAPTLADVHYALTDWAYNRLNMGPLYLSLIGPGGKDTFQIMPGHILKASDPLDPNRIDTLKYSLDSFQERTGRDLICLVESGSSGSFCDDLIDSTTPLYTRTIITSTDDGASYLDSTGSHSFVGILVELFKASRETGLFADTGISHTQRVHLLEALFSEARQKFWSLEYPFSTQPPQMITSKGPHTLCTITLSIDPLKIDSLEFPMGDSHTPTITNPEESIALKATGHYLDGSGDITEQIYFHSSDPTILTVTSEGIVSPHTTNAYNGKAYILATIIDPNFTQSPTHDPHIPPLGGVTGRIPINVTIPTWDEKAHLPLAIIVAGEKETCAIAQYAYLTLLERGYSRERIFYLTHPNEERDSHKEYEADPVKDGDPAHDSVGVSSSSQGLREALAWAKERGTPSLTLILLNADPPLGQWLDELQDEDGIPQISIIMESSNSTPLIDHLKGENRCIITSAPEGGSSLYSHGLISFTYYLLNYLQAGATLAGAYDNACSAMSAIENFLREDLEIRHEPSQFPRLDNRSLAHNISLGGSYLVCQDQPVITSMELLSDSNAITINQKITMRAEVSDLIGIERVWGVVAHTPLSPQVSSNNQEISTGDLIRIDFEQRGKGVFEGTHTGFTKKGPHSLLIFAQNTKGAISLPYSYTLNLKGERNALLIAGYEKDTHYFSDLLSHAQWVLLEKQFSRVSLLPEPGGERITPETIYCSLHELAQEADLLFIYLIGRAEMHEHKVAVSLNETEYLDPDTLNRWLDELPKCTHVLLIDTPHAYRFVTQAPQRIYVCSTSDDQTAYFGEEGRCAFSQLFFTSIYSGVNLYDAYRLSSDAIDYYSPQKPILEDGVNGRLAKTTSFGIPSMSGYQGPSVTMPDGTIFWGSVPLWVTIQKPDPGTRVWALVKPPGKGKEEIEEVYFTEDAEEWGHFKADYTFDQKGTYKINTYCQFAHGLLSIYERQYQAREPLIYYRDLDQDGFGDPNTFVLTYYNPSDAYAQYVLKSGDCDDTAPFVNPQGVDIYDGEDNNCNGLSDESYHFACGLELWGESEYGMDEIDSIIIGLGADEFLEKEKYWSDIPVAMHLALMPSDAYSTQLEEVIHQTGERIIKWYLEVNKGLDWWSTAYDGPLLLRWDPNCLGPGYFQLRRGWDDRGKILIYDMKATDYYYTLKEDRMSEEKLYTIFRFTIIWSYNEIRDKEEQRIYQLYPHQYYLLMKYYYETYRDL
ncbi:MAG: hypothetical protein ACMUJM_17630 [bacterium]